MENASERDLVADFEDTLEEEDDLEADFEDTLEDDLEADFEDTLEDDVEIDAVFLETATFLSSADD